MSFPYTHKLSNVKAGNHTYTAVAFNDRGSAKTSESLTVFVGSPTQAPDISAPTWPTGSAISFGFNSANWEWWRGNCSFATKCKMHLSWPAASDNIGVVRYDILRATNGKGSEKIGTTGDKTRSFTDGSITKKTDYTYSIVAVDATNNFT